VTKKKTRVKSEAVRFLEGLRGGPMTFGEMVRSLRECDEFTQEDVARKVGVSKQHISDVENGRRQVSMERAIRWAKALGYPPAHFVTVAAQEELDRAGSKLKVTVTAAA
jgi:transcriptional regulator with XRE-family HTH domain